MSCDTVFARISRPANQVFAFMADPNKLGQWALGAWNGTVDETGLIHANSLRDGAGIYVRVASHSDVGLIDYLVGTRADALQPRIFARIVSGSVLGCSGDECGLMMSALRTDDMDDARWASLIATHAVEIDLIKSAIETGYDPHQPQG